MLIFLERQGECRGEGGGQRPSRSTALERVVTSGGKNEGLVPSQKLADPEGRAGRWGWAQGRKQQRER